MDYDAKKPLVSVIIPTFNRVEQLQEAINSILHQSYKNFEIIVVDDGSTDATADVVKVYQEPRISYVWQENSGLPAKARNVGISHAKGEFIAFLDSDDLWAPTKLQYELHEFQKDPLVSLVCSNGIKFNKNGNLGLINPQSKHQILSFALLMHSNKIITSSVVLRKTALEETGIFDIDRRLYALEDLDLWLRIATKYRVKYIALALVRYRVHASQASGDLLNQFNMEHYRKRKIIYSKYQSSNPLLVEDSLRFILSIIKLARIRRNLQQKKLKLIDILKDKSLRVNEKMSIFFQSSQNSPIVRHFFNFISTKILRK